MSKIILAHNSSKQRHYFDSAEFFLNGKKAVMWDPHPKILPPATTVVEKHNMDKKTPHSFAMKRKSRTYFDSADWAKTGISLPVKKYNV